MKIVLNKAEKNRKTWNELKIGDVHLGKFFDGRDTSEVFLKVSETQSFNLTDNVLMTRIVNIDFKRKVFPNAELHLNEE